MDIFGIHKNYKIFKLIKNAYHLPILYIMDELPLNLLQTVKMKLLRNEEEKRQSNIRTLEKILNLLNYFLCGLPCYVRLNCIKIMLVHV
jgi:hypothetical protein